jgi:hypothetical protein
MLGAASFALPGVIGLGLLAFLVPALPAVAGPAGSSQVASSGWSAKRLPLPPGGSSNSFMVKAISCSSARQCAGGGSYRSTSVSDILPALLTLSGKKWTAAEGPLPAGASTGNRASGVVASVACPSATKCFAGGNYSAGGDNLAMLLAWSGQKWAARRAPLPAGAYPNPDALVSGMSCPSVSWCTAVGQYGAAGNQYGLILRLSGKKWRAIAAPVPAGSEAVGSLNAVSCPSVTRCFAGGWQYAQYATSMQPVMLTWFRNKWSVVKVSLPSAAAANPLAAIGGISCPTVSQCVAVGSYQDSAGNQQSVLLTWRGAKWTARKAPLPGNAGTNPWVTLNTVSCPASSRCTAGGGYEDGASTPLGLLLTWSKQRWVAAEAPTIAYSIYAMSCPSVSRCYGLSAGIGQPVLLTGP